ncbi:DUF6059 family protein [Streptomyces sp. NPDC029041]|uniref:DUF6059 family protein n=1 Tax=Streptomyces sp. NPDC029041 TaxID=3155727 RepID=UPI0033FDDDF6
MSQGRRWPARLLRHAWSGLVAMGTVYLAGETSRPQTPDAPPAGPPAGHPERLRPDVPLTRLERALLRELGER